MITLTRIKPLVLTVIAILISHHSEATHLIGGNMSYSYVGPDPADPGNEIYEVDFQAYLDCNSPNWSPGSPGGFPDDPIQLGVYEGELAGSQATFMQTMNLSVTGIFPIDPTLPPGCNFSTNICVALVSYSGTISLPPGNNGGYHILYDRCCRPGGIANLNNSGDQALTYKVFIPTEENSTTLLNNNSAFFTDTLSSYICRGDTATIPNSAIDPDGDSLVYTLVTPFSGNTTNINPVANYAGFGFNPYPNPPANVTWAANHGVGQIFGPTGFQSINSVTGNTRFMSDVAGTYVAAVEIAEYRNGRLISLTRRDIQLLVIDCPANELPRQDTTNLDSTALSPEFYEIRAGDSICISLEFYDPDGDSLFLTASGNLFDPNMVNPEASILSPVEGDSSLVTQFCWNTVCSQGRNQPYNFTLNVRDNGCPPKTVYQNFSISVLPFDGPDEITGLGFLCSGDSIQTYSVPDYPGAVYDWQVTGGNILSGSGTHEIDVEWTSAFGNLQVEITDNNGCVAVQSLDVSIMDVSPDAGSDTALCPGDSVMIGGKPLPEGVSATWSPLAGVDNPDTTVTNVRPDSTTTYVLTLSDTTGTCIRTDSVTITVFEPQFPALEPQYYLCPGDTLWIESQIDSVSWSPNYFVTNPNGSVTGFSPPQDTSYTVIYFDSNTCSGSDSMELIVNNNIPTDAGPDQPLCTGDEAQLGGSPTSFPPVRYQWTPASGLSDDTIANPVADPDTTTTYYLETFSDTCRGYDTVTVSVFESPEIAASGDAVICEGDTAQISFEIISGSGDFFWNNGHVIDDSTSSDPNVFPNESTVFRVLLTDTNDCSAEDSVVIGVNALPETDAGAGDTFVCKSDPVILGPDSVISLFDYEWSPNIYIDNTNIPNPTVRALAPTDYVLAITDTNGCTGRDTIAVNVTSIESGFDTLVCPGAEVPINFTAQGGREPYLFTVVPSDGVEDPASGNTVIIPERSEMYSVIVTDSAGCSDTSSIDIEYSPLSTPEPEYSFKPGCEINLIIFENGDEFAIDDEIWVIDGDTMVFEYGKDSLLYNLGRPMEVLLITMNDDGCTDTGRLDIDGMSFEEVLDLDMPNVFTPNGDGVNDFFEFRGNRNLVDCIEMQIYNRWGNLIYETTGGFNSWDGRNFSGEELPQGVYFYTINVNGIQQKGSVTLLR